MFMICLYIDCGGAFLGKDLKMLRSLVRKMNIYKYLNAILQNDQ